MIDLTKKSIIKNVIAKGHDMESLIKFNIINTEVGHKLEYLFKMVYNK
jgi:hypothetical protein